MINLLSLLIIVYLVNWIINSKGNLPVSSWIITHYEFLVNFYLNNKVFVVFIFFILHFFSAVLSLPGSCTFLNIAAGAIFGFIPAVCIVYPTTLISGGFGYWLGRKIPLNNFPNKMQGIVDKIKKYVLKNDFMNLVILRLSPFFPYGMLNIVLGIMKIDIKLFFMTTLVGIFFDVILLTSIGAYVFRGANSNNLSNTILGIGFFSLFILVYFVKIVVEKRMKSLKERSEF